MAKLTKILESIFVSPRREFAVSALLLLGLLDFYFLSGSLYVLLPTAIIGAIIPFQKAWRGVRNKTITIEAFNFLAVITSFVTGEFTSASFIGLMLTFAAYLDWYTESRATNAVEELLKLKPNKAYRVNGELILEVLSDDVSVGDILVVKNGERVPAYSNQ